jgi:glycerate kinase
MIGPKLVLIAPDCYGDSLTAVAAARAIANGWGLSRPQDRLVLAPQSDGGPGFVDVLAGRLGVVRHSRVSGPLTGVGDGAGAVGDVDARWVFERSTGTAFIECAQACGLALLGGPPTPETALTAHSRGVGQLVDAALQHGAKRIVVGLGGTACTDGGSGLIDALGGLERARRKLADVTLVAATDVEHPLLGPSGAARVFGPQKGADSSTVDLLEQRMSAWAVTLDACAGRNVSALPGAGAAGGLGAALLALGGTRESGAAIIAEHTGLAADIAAADVIVTGEGRFDDQSLRGKVISALASDARLNGTPVLVLAGQVTLTTAQLADAGVDAAYAIADFAGSVQLAMDDAANQLEGLAAKAAAELTRE